MKGTAPISKDAADRPLNRSDLAILATVARLHYLTAAQVSRLVFPGCHDEDRYARRRLARLVAAGLLLRLKPLALPHRGAAPHVFTLTKAGRRLLGLPTGYLRPSEEQSKARNLLFIAHTLATIDALIAAELLCRSSPVAMPRLLTERELKGNPARVETSADGTKRSVAVIPDAWFELAVGTRKPVAIAVELDRGSEDQKRWRAKVAALAAWAVGRYREAFGNETLTIATVTPDEARRDQLRTWTAQELDRIGQRELAEIFLFTDADPVATSPQRFFFGQVWFEPRTVEPMSLLTPAVRAQPVAGSAGASVKEVWRAGP